MRRLIGRTAAHLLFALALALAAAPTFAGDAAADYFPIKADRVQVYERLAPDMEGDSRHSAITCTKTDRKDGEVLGLFRKGMFVGPMTVSSQEVYAVSGNRVFLCGEENAFGDRHLYEDRPIILQVPPAGKTLKWKYSPENDPEVTRTCSAERGKKLKGKDTTYTDVLVVTVDTKNKRDPDYNSVIKQFYAKGVGLVREELYVKGELVKELSFGLTRVE